MVWDCSLCTKTRLGSFGQYTGASTVNLFLTPNSLTSTTWPVPLSHEHTAYEGNNAHTLRETACSFEYSRTSSSAPGAAYVRSHHSDHKYASHGYALKKGKHATFHSNTSLPRYASTAPVRKPRAIVIKGDRFSQCIVQWYKVLCWGQREGNMARLWVAVLVCPNAQFNNPPLQTMCIQSRSKPGNLRQ